MCSVYNYATQMFSRNVSTFLLAALLLASLMCVDASAQMYSATGRVIDAVTAQPIASTHFVYGQPAIDTNNGGFVSFHQGQTNTAGEFKLQNLKPGNYALYIAASLDRSDLY